MLTDAGAELVPVLVAAATVWVTARRTPPNGPPLRFRHHGHDCEPVVACSTCSQPLTSSTIEPVPGTWRAVGAGTAIVGRAMRRRQ